ncbi:Fungal Zn binuclear cluster domain containing protein/C6 transcription factor [Zymoseptoria brevis]|uniref:Fungal Zn binuclear cluster domain containing protein/C6 transcription factor n=1 Tax=Zymoseptoria brevis TaxID=1047168 RepID=A0A0F4GP68_9PEZI|nr:Fungal Zn binuclear cluster domain containing protein/C6 transcription factor [Zymoseptoria brevis]
MAAKGYALAQADQYTARSQSPKTQSAAGLAPGHQRTYQACIPCRQRKVRCDLGSVDNPHDPPCTRCRREAKECYFSATRRKKKNAGDENTGSEAGDDNVTYEIRSNRKRPRTSAPPEVAVEEDDYDYDDPPRTPGGSIGRTQPLRRPPPPKPIQYGEEDEKQSEHTTALLQQAEVHGGHDALKLLYSAAVHGRADSSTSSGVARPAFTGFTASSLPSATSPIMEKAGNVSYTNGPLAMFQHDGTWKTPTDQMSSKPANFARMPSNTPDYSTALKAWTRFKFVRAGWFTAQEGIDYILYFYKHLAPLTPVALPDFRQPSTHKKMLEEEPMLTVSMLTIASRHMKLDGPGSNSRPYAIHQKLWAYLSGMIDRVVWGQEQFGGGFCGAGAQPGCDVHPLTRKGLRTLGSVESLVLLTEWHPRAMHFPPEEDDDDLMMPDQSYVLPEMTGQDGAKGIGGHRMDAWLEPCWRSDRMCWMLLGMAMSLAMEIGVFDSSEWQRHAPSTDGQPLSAADLTSYDKRRCNVRDLLLVYVTQTSGRLGLTSMLPSYYSKPDDSERHKRNGQQDSVQEVTLHFWLRMASLMREGNNKIFANKTFTRDLIRNGNYKAALAQLQPPLEEWRRDFDSCQSMPKYMRAILGIEYEYCRVYLNALALQAVAERCANDHPSPVQVVDPPLEMARAAIASSGDGRPDVAITPSTLSKWLGGDRHYFVTVGDAARNLLKIVVEDLYPDGFLRHAPVRTYFRIISVAIMLLKSFSLGATESDVTDSLTLMDRTVEALRTCIVDDVHVASRFADLLDTLARNLKPRLIRIAADGRAGRSRRVSHAGLTAQHAQTGYGPNGRQHEQQQQAQARATSGSTPNASQQWGAYNNMMLPNGTPGNNALFGISNDTYDLMGNDNSYTVMPPPGFGTHSPNNIMSSGPGSGNYDPYSTSSNFGEQDWLALPLDPLLNMSGDVEQTMYGPQLGGQDMLELLLNSNTTNGFH